MLRLLGTAVTLGLAGLDPTGALLVVTALVAGASRAGVRAFGLTVMVGAPLLGSVLALTLGARLSHVDLWVLVPAGRVGAVVGLGLGVVLLVVAAVRVLHRPPPHPHHRPRRASTGALTGAALVYVASLVIDPTFVAVTIVAGRAEHAVEVVAMQAVWVLLSQLPLLALLLAVREVGRERAVERFQGWWARVRPVVGVLVTLALVVAGLALAADALWWFSSGHFLLPDPHHRR